MDERDGVLTAAAVRSTSPAIQRLTVTFTRLGSNPFWRTHSFISAKRDAFQSLVAKLR